MNFPDVKNCFTQGATLAEAIENAEDVLCSMLYEYEEQGAEINPATDIIEDVVVKGGILCRYYR